MIICSFFSYPCFTDRIHARLLHVRAAVSIDGAGLLETAGSDDTSSVVEDGLGIRTHSSSSPGELKPYVQLGRWPDMNTAPEDDAALHDRKPAEGRRRRGRRCRHVDSRPVARLHAAVKIGVFQDANNNPMKPCKPCTYVYTRAWISMGVDQET